MGKILFLLLLAAVGYALWKAYAVANRRRAVPPKERAIESIVRCSFCDLHLPASEAIAHAERFFCSIDHQRAFDSTRPPADR